MSDEERRNGPRGDDEGSSGDQESNPQVPINPPDDHYEFGQEPPERPERRPQETRED